MKYYTVQEKDKRPDGSQWIIAAPSGCARRSDGPVYLDGTDPIKSGPEMTVNSFAAFRFNSYKAALVQANKLISWEIKKHTD